jgi:hypothetical protein
LQRERVSAEAAPAWFSTLGEPLGEAEEADIAVYLGGLGLAPAAPTLRVESWSQAAAIARQPAERWWNVEEAERARLERAARLDPADREWLALTGVLDGAAAVAAARSGFADAGLIGAAAGAAICAAYQYRLARAAGAGADHPFVRKYALFAGGRWPLGVYGERFAIF